MTFSKVRHIAKPGTLAAIRSKYIMQLDLIYTQQEMIISKKHRDWSFWQDYFTDYKASLSFDNLRAMTEFLISEYNLREAEHEALTDSINRINADLIVLEITKTKEALLNFREFTPPIKTAL